MTWSYSCVNRTRSILQKANLYPQLDSLSFTCVTGTTWQLASIWAVVLCFLYILVMHWACGKIVLQWMLMEFWICFPAFGASIPSDNLWVTYLSQLVAKRRLQILLNFEPLIWWKKEENLICKAHLKHGGQNTDPQSMENLRGYYFERALWKELLFIYLHMYILGIPCVRFSKDPKICRKAMLKLIIIVGCDL